MPRKLRSRDAASSNAASPDAALRELRAFGLRYPQARTRSPWPGHLDLAVNDRTFAFLSVEGEPFSISCKLPHSAAMALNLPFAQPTPYGLGRSGWVSATPPADEPVPVDLLKAWIDESYRALAPKKLLALLPPSASGMADVEPAARVTVSKSKPRSKPKPKPAEARTTGARAKPATARPAKRGAARSTDRKPPPPVERPGRRSAAKG
jgi:predicted DNA-binding protein (MmcQ/YjbR family)